MVNDIIQFKILNLNINFEGVGIFNNKKVCVKNVLPGEVVKAKIIFEKENFIMANLVEVVVKNPLRILPSCKHYYSCGGCSLQVLSPKDALKLKGDVIKEYFSNIFSGEVKVNKSEDDFFYRNKVVFSVKNNLIVGLKQENSNIVVDIDKCIISNEIINKILVILKKFLNDEKVDFEIKYFAIRNFNNNFILTVVIRNSLTNFEKFNLLIKYLNDCFNKSEFGIFININPKNNEIFGKTWKHVYGIKNLNVDILNLKAQIHPYSFLQVNYSVMQKLYNTVLNFIDANSTVIEGYSGAGLLSCLIAKKVKNIYSIEVNKNATEDANKLKKFNNIFNLENINGSCSNIVPNLKINLRNTIFVLDPPQSGCDKSVLDTILKNRVEKIIYISCNPYTLKQNVYYLKDYYNITNLEIFDMFPQTSHVESVAVLKLKGDK